MGVVIAALTFLMFRPSWKNYLLFGLAALILIPIFGFVAGWGHISQNTIQRGLIVMGLYAAFGPAMIFIGRAAASAQAKKATRSNL